MGCWILLSAHYIDAKIISRRYLSCPDFFAAVGGNSHHSRQKNGEEDTCKQKGGKYENDNCGLAGTDRIR